MEKKPNFNKFVGCIWGLAIGDALGYPVEFMSRAEIMKRFTPFGIRQMEPSSRFPAGSYTDDTQMSLAIANALIKNKDNSVEEIMKNISTEFASWYRFVKDKEHPENDRDSGLTCLEGARKLEQGVNWKYSGVIGSEGCGAAMRTAPIGLAFYNNLDKLKEIATASAISTHNSDVAVASAVANAYLVARSLTNDDYKSSLQDLLKFTDGISKKFTDKIKQIPYAMNLPNTEALDLLGQGWTGHEAVALALYCALKNDYDFEKTVLMGANTNGDSDSIASIAGGIVGAYQGIESIPKLFLRPLENRDNLEETAEQLCRKYLKTF